MSAPALAIRDLRYAYPRGPVVLDLPEFTLAAGERLFLKGPSGSGKSTLLGLIGGVLRPTAGRISVLGTDYSGLKGAALDRFRADHIGYVFQQFNLLPYLGLLDNVLLPCRFSKLRAERATKADGSPTASATRLLTQLGLAEWLKAGRPVAELSVGQQQRVALARALIGAPELIICDEPTSALDADRRESFIRLLHAQLDGSGASLVFVSHDAALAPLFPRQAALDTLNRAAREAA